MPTFKDLEQAGWTEKAPAYDDHFAEITRQAIAPILDALGNLAGRDLLDIACGTGDLARAATARGARVTGVDFAPTMVSIAAAKAPGARFVVADAEALEFVDQSFDAATCSFGLWHMAEPDRALAEAARVLRHGGRLAFTSWLPPEQGFDLMAMLATSIRAHGTLEVDLPPSPSPYRFADRQQAAEALAAAGFSAIRFDQRIAWWHGADAQQLLDLVYKSTVRAPMLIEAQSPGSRRAIREDLRAQVEAKRLEGRISLRWPFLLVTAIRQAG
jgi:ubiquinone/menaquinone biosynthesis C-methylase UbiE